MIKAPKGTYDVLPNISHAWRKIEDAEREVARLAGYREIRTPVFEHTELFLRGVGDTTDIVQKEMYTFKDKGDRSITLKPEGTAGVVRAMLESGLNQGVMPLKVYYLSSPIFRYEAPQSGRMREHHQFGVEAFGARQPTLDAEVISIPLDVLTKLGLSDFALNINSIGCPKCRPHYHERLREYLTQRKDKLCATCNDRLLRNPLRILDCKSDECQAELKDAPVMLDFLCDECAAHFAGLKDALDAIGVSYAVNPRIVRGLDYYTKTVFEIIISADEGKLTVCGGGRYDELVSELGGQPTPAIGFGMGIERLLMLLQRQNKSPEAEPICDVFVATLTPESRLEAVRYVSALRALGVKADMDHVGRSLKAQFKFADKVGAGYVLILGGDEAAQGEAVLRNLTAHTEDRVALEGLAQTVAETILAKR